MPTVVREAGFAVVVHVRGEHNPPHVHVYKAGGEVRVKLNDRTLGPSLWDVTGTISDKDVVRAVELVWRHQDRLLQAWSNVNGHL